MVGMRDGKQRMPGGARHLYPNDKSVASSRRIEHFTTLNG